MNPFKRPIFLHKFDLKQQIFLFICLFYTGSKFRQNLENQMGLQYYKYRIQHYVFAVKKLW